MNMNIYLLSLIKYFASSEIRRDFAAVGAHGDQSHQIQEAMQEVHRKDMRCEALTNQVRAGVRR